MNKICEVQVSYRPNLSHGRHPKISGSASVADLRWDIFSEDEIEYRESFSVLLLNHANRVLGISRVSEGGTATTVVDVKMIIQRALLCNASGIILVHNHPSGNLLPSREDDRLTRKVIDAAALFDIRVLDHVIMSADGYYSYSECGKI